MNHPKHAASDAPIQDLLKQRFSAYGFLEKPVAAEDLRALFEAARWAASSYNEQPWRFLVAAKDSDPAGHAVLLSCLVEGNQAWAKFAPVLAIGVVMKNFARNGKPNRAAEHDLGLATANLTFEATARGLNVHPMIGILPERVRELCGLPADAEPLTGLAIGYAGEQPALPENLRGRDAAPRTRHGVDEFVFGVAWGRPRF